MEQKTVFLVYSEGNNFGLELKLSLERRYTLSLPSNFKGKGEEMRQKLHSADLMVALCSDQSTILGMFCAQRAQIGKQLFLFGGNSASIQSTIACLVGSNLPVRRFEFSSRDAVVNEIDTYFRCRTNKLDSK